MHHFKSDLIKNMDHMRIVGTKPSSVILVQTKWFKKLKSDAQKVHKQAVQSQRGWCNKPTNYNFNHVKDSAH